MLEESVNLATIYLLKVNTRKRRGICLKLIKTPERRH